MFRRYALCLLPVAIAFAMLIAGMAGWIPQEDIYMQLVVGLLIVGGIGCAISVSVKVYRGLENDAVVKWLLTIMAFIGVTIAYGGIVFAGCCGVLLVGSNFS